MGCSAGSRWFPGKQYIYRDTLDRKTNLSQGVAKETVNQTKHAICLYRLYITQLYISCNDFRVLKFEKSPKDFLNEGVIGNTTTSYSN